MVYCVAYNCKTSSGQGIGLFVFPKDENRRKIWIAKIKRKNFVPSRTSRVCAKHFTNDQFVVNPLLAASIGYKMKQFRLKPDAVPTEFDFPPPVAEIDTKRKHTRRSSLAVTKRRRIETLSQIFDESGTSGSDEHTTSMIHEADQLEEDVPTEFEVQPGPSRETTSGACIEPQQYNAYVQTVQVEMKNFTCNVNIGKTPTVDVGVQTHSMIQSSLKRPSFSSSPERSDDDDDRMSEENDPDWTPVEGSREDESTTVGLRSPATERKFLVFESNLRELLEAHCIYCGAKKNIEYFNVIGTGLSVTLRCMCHSLSKWSSQPMSGKMPLGNLILAGAMLFSGSSISKVLTLFQHSSICCFTDRTFFSIQTAYLLPTITNVWKSKQVRLLEEIQENGSKVKLGGDARCCTPGHTAKYGSYSVMDVEHNKVIDMQLVQSNEVSSSYHMELEGLKRCFVFLTENNITVESLITDRHPSIKKYMREEKQDVKHMFDVWHVAKGVNKKLEKIGKKKRGFDVIGRWARSISNHIYWCAASSDGDGEMVQQKWSSILNHITNIHQGHGSKFPNCLHDHLDDREWIKKGGKVYQALEKVVQERTLMKDIMKLSPAEQTSSLESYHRVVCFFAPKSIHFMHAQMEARLYLAAMHFNENASRPQACTATGTAQYRVSFPKARKGEGVAKEVKIAASFCYVQELFTELLSRRGRFKTVTSATEEMKQIGKSRPLPLSHNVSRRPKEEIVDSHKSRFNK